MDQRDDAGDPGLLGPSRGQGPQNSLRGQNLVWRPWPVCGERLSQYEDDRTASSVDRNRAMESGPRAPVPVVPERLSRGPRSRFTEVGHVANISRKD